MQNCMFGLGILESNVLHNKEHAERGSIQYLPLNLSPLQIPFLSLSTLVIVALPGLVSKCVTVHSVRSSKGYLGINS